MDNSETFIDGYLVRACPEQLADGMGWSEHFFIDEMSGGRVDEHSYTGLNVHPTKGAAITACYAIAREEIIRGL